MFSGYMQHANYSLDIISHHPQFEGQTLRKYLVDGIETVGAWGEEAFEIRFTNHTFNKVQVKLSLDGTDLLTGSPANTDAIPQMWVVQPFGTLALKAYPESDQGGAAFIFTNVGNSVAAHTHGDLSCRGIVAAAVFTEGHVEPIRVCNPWTLNIPGVIDITTPAPLTQPWEPYYPNYPIWCGDGQWTDNVIGGEIYGTYINNPGMDSINISMNAGTKGSSNYTADSYQVAAGAGQYTPQNITYTSGLIKSVFSETVRVRFVWWDELVAKLKQNNASSAQPSGFPGDNKRSHIDLKNTPRQNVATHRSAPVQDFQRV